jgi:hypothetical protein
VTLAILLVARVALFAVTLARETRLALSADTDAVSEFDVGDLRANADGCADNLVAYAARVVGWAL